MDTRTFETDSWCRTIDTDVVESGELDGCSCVRLRETIFYPEGGGQPTDLGRIGEAEVLDVQRDGDRILHLLDRPVAPGPVRIELNWSRRFDHMQQHTGQHLLTAICQDRYGWATHAFHLGESYSAIDLDTSALSAGRMLEVEDAVNMAIRESRPIRTLLVGREAMAGMNVRTRGLSDDVGEAIRLVEIEGIDLNTCGGTHVKSTSELQVCRLTGQEKAHRFLRLRFLFGNRVVALLRAAAGRETALKQVLGASPDAFAEVAAGWDRDRRDLARTLRRTETELAGALAEGMMGVAETFIVRHLRGRDAGFLKTLSNRVLAGSPEKTLALFGDDGKAAFFLVAAGGESTLDVQDLGSRIQEALHGKGGGRGVQYQGRGPSSGRIAAAMEAIMRGPSSGPPSAASPPHPEVCADPPPDDRC